MEKPQKEQEVVKGVKVTHLEVTTHLQVLDIGECEVLHVCEDSRALGVIEVFYESVKDTPHHPTYFALTKTGVDIIPSDFEHVASVRMQDGFIWHVYREPKKRRGIFQ